MPPVGYNNTIVESYMNTVYRFKNYSVQEKLILELVPYNNMYKFHNPD
jgi:hypothetical protein